jgi:crotonobetainyl-CoA:carnitine CoA-transferase CaiB-like acyl-CoA transferase
MAGPLEHLVVIEAATVMPGSIVGMLLADHGATVIKVEPPGGAFYAHDLPRKAWDRGKKSIELDIADAAQRETLRQLIATADVFVHSLEASQASAYGFDQPSLAAAQPGLVVCALTAYGQETPFASRPYGESLAAALLGTMIDKSSALRPGPVYLGHPALHYGQAFLATIDILAALRARRLTGEGQGVEASLLDAFLAQSAMNNWWNEHGISYIKKGDSSARDRFGKTRLVTGLFQCGDGLYLQMHTGGQGGFKAAFEVLGFGDRIQKVTAPEMSVPLTDEEYQIARVEIYDAFLKKPREEWIKLFHAVDVAALPVLEPAEVLLDDQVEFVGQRIALPDPDFGTIYQAAPAVRFAASPASAPQPAPSVGAHNAELATLIGSPKRGARASGEPLGAALSGIRILDFSSFFAAGYGARLLSDLGADVIKVETPEGDQMRPLSNCFDAAQRGKRDIVVNLKSPDGLAIVRKLVETADIVVHNLRPGKADKLGIGYQALSEINPKLIYAYLPGYGSKGPKSLLKSFAPLVSGWTGLLYEGGGEGNPPTPAVFGNEDYNNGFLGAVGMLMALERRAETGRGDYLECPQLHSSLFTTSEHFLDANKKVVYGMRLDAEQMGFNALDRLYATKDGKFLCISCRSDERFSALARALGKPELVSDARFASARARSVNDKVLLEILKSALAELSAEEAHMKLNSAGAACELARTDPWLDTFFWEPWAEQSGRVVEDKNSIYGHVRMIGIVNRLNKTPGVRKKSAPRLGEHTRELLRELSYSASEIEGWIEQRVVIDAADKSENKAGLAKAG